VRAGSRETSEVIRSLPDRHRRCVFDDEHRSLTMSGYYGWTNRTLGSLLVTES
jgi:hypothetical protein